MVLRRVLVVCVAAGMTLVAACGSDSHTSSQFTAPPSPAPRLGQRLDARLPSVVAKTMLVSSTGRPLDLASLGGRVIVVSDMMTLCQETCPLDTANIVAAARAVQRAGLGNKVAFLSITIDPHRDTQHRLDAYRKLYDPTPNDWQVATGGPDQLAAMWKTLGVDIERVPDNPPAPHDWLTGKPLTYDLTHSDELLFIDTHQHERFLLEGAPHVAAGAPIPARLRKFFDKDGHKNLNHPDPQTWTLPQELQVLSWLTGRHITDTTR